MRTRTRKLRPGSAHAVVVRVVVEAGFPLLKADLIVRAWRASPAQFGLTGLEKLHPCSNKVICCLCGYRGLIAMGYLERVGAGYVATPQGRAFCGVKEVKPPRVEAGPCCPKCRCVDVGGGKCSNCGHEWEG